MNNGAHFTDLSKESAVVGTIVTGLFDRVPERCLIPTRAFVDDRWRIIYGAAKALRSVGMPVCSERVSDLIAAHQLDGQLQKAIDLTKTFPWRNWPEHSDQSQAFCPSTISVEYSLEVLGELFEKREAAAIAKRMEAGELSHKEAIEALREIGPETRSLPPMVSADELCSNPPPTPPEIIEGILHRGSKMAFGGGSKSFKTWALLDLSICIATGRDWLGFATTKGRVLYVNFELPAFAIEKRIREIRHAMGLNDTAGNLTVWNLRGHAADADTILPIISREAKAGDFCFMVLDPLYKLLGSRDENASRDMASLMNAVERVTVEANLATRFRKSLRQGKCVRQGKYGPNQRERSFRP